tara:strand:- start:1551 stop:1724 length:174 start_codon:yes stop_codon:yes gene_type:complete
MIKVKIDARGILKLVSMVSNVTDIPENPINDPIERSNSPLIISKVTPIARIPISDET